MVSCPHWHPLPAGSKGICIDFQRKEGCSRTAKQCKYAHDVIGKPATQACANYFQHMKKSKDNDNGKGGGDKGKGKGATPKAKSKARAKRRLVNPLLAKKNLGWAPVRISATTGTARRPPRCASTKRTVTTDTTLRTQLGACRDSRSGAVPARGAPGHPDSWTAPWKMHAHLVTFHLSF